MEATVGPQLRWEAMARVLGRCGIDVGFSRMELISEFVYTQLASNADFAVEIASKYLCLRGDVSPEQIQADLECIESICQDTYNAPRLEIGSGLFVSLQDRIIRYCLALRRVVESRECPRSHRDGQAVAVLARARRELVRICRQVVVALNEVVSDLHRSVLGLGHTPIKEAPGPYRWMLNVNLRACREARGNRQERRRWAREVITLDLLIPHQTVFFRQAREELSVAAGELSRHVCI